MQVMVRIESIQPRKQRKARYNAPAHLRGKFLSAPLSPDLRKEYRIRSVRVVKGDSVKVLRGNAAGTEGVVDAVDTDRSLIVVQGVAVPKADGTEVPRPVNPSNVQVTKLNLKDPRRAGKLSEAR
ncbi:lsu ribosomal protein l26e (l24p) [hydrocarbon metagenome]|uniref:Lsu ribosomal protein l26e (L24p) n=1 Tax=hydrocarbon metagenome TaxID=938273 RepID=A0A0W8F0L8_9ZZZZ